MALMFRMIGAAAFLAALTVLVVLAVASVPDGWISLSNASSFSRNAAQAVALMAFPAAALVLAKWHKFVRKDYALSFLLALYAMVLSQVPVHLGGMTGWGPDLILLSGIGRWVLFGSAALFARAALRDECPPWGWVSVVAGALVFTVLL